jgi:hypothetical protein
MSKTVQLHRVSKISTMPRPMTGTAEASTGSAFCSIAVCADSGRLALDPLDELKTASRRSATS